MIIHYYGDNPTNFYDFLGSLIEEVIIEFYEEKMIKQLINYNYFYFDEYERKKILDNCIQMKETEEYLELIENQEYIKKEAMKYR